MKVQIILAGIGGQGILFASRIFSELGLKLGFDVMGSETHGMSQRGGSVIAHLKLGPFHSPVIRTGTADLLYSFEKNEGYRTLPFLRRGGLCFVNLGQEDQFDTRIIEYLKGKEIDVFSCDASGEAFRLGSVMSANIILIGYSVGTGMVPFRYGDLKSVLESISKKKDCKINVNALETGYRAGKMLRKGPKEKHD